MKEYLLSRINLPSACFSALVAKIVIFGADYASAIALISVTAMYGYNKFLSSKDDSKSQNINQKISELQDAVTSIKMGSIRKVSNEPEKAPNKRYF